jgi:Zn-finger nucleic acid-binding protein
MPGPMSCTHCSVKMVMSERAGVEIDYCPQCRGVWLDRGELDKIIERAAREAAPPEPPRAPQAPYPPQAPFPPQSGYGHGHHKRRKSWLEEIFD